MLTGALLVLLVLLIVLAIPVTLTYRASWPQLVADRAELEWAFGLVRARIPLSQTRAPLPQNDKAKRSAGNAEQAARRGSHVVAAVRHKPFRRRILRFISDLWQAIHKKDVRLRVRVGLGDPADTGQLWAVVGPLAGMLANVRDASISIEPEFFDAIFTLDSAGRIRIIPLQMFYLCVVLLLSPHVWRGVMLMNKGAT
jgi:hypothetical protein